MYDLSRKSFIPNIWSKTCLLPSYDSNKTYFGYDVGTNTFYQISFNNEREWRDYYITDLSLAALEIIFIKFGIVAFLLGSIISIWRKYDPEFQNLHKPALNENDHEMSRIESSSDAAINPSFRRSA